MKANRLLRPAPLATLFSLFAASLAMAEPEGGGGGFSEKSLWDMIRLGGPIMIPLFLFSVAMVWLVIDGVQRSGQKRLMPEGEVEKLRNFFRAGD
jgi:hypothetical protein